MKFKKQSKLMLRLCVIEMRPAERTQPVLAISGMLSTTVPNVPDADG